MKLHAIRQISASALALLVAASTTFAQTETQKPTQTPSDATPLPPVVRVKPWSFGLGFHESYESDVQFSGAESGDWFHRVDARIGRDWRGRRGAATLGGDVSQIIYQQATTLNRLMYNFGGATSFAVTPRLSWRTSAASNRSYSEDSRVLTDAGLVFPRILTVTNSASNELAYRLSPRTTLDSSVSMMQITFQDSTLEDGLSLTGRVHLSRAMTRAQAVGISVGHTVSNITGDIQGILGTWQWTAGRVLTVNAQGGLRPYKLDGFSGYRFSPGGSVGFSARFSPTQSVAGSYERAVEHAVGFGGTHLAHRLNGNYQIALGRRVSLDGSASYGYNSYPERPGYSNDGKTMMLSARYLLGHQLYLGTGYGVWVRSDTGSPSMATHRLVVSLTYGSAFGFRRGDPELPRSTGEQPTGGSARQVRR